MKHTLQLALLAGFALLLTACGFHLRGLGGPIKPLPFATLYLEAGGKLIEPDLRTVLARQPKLTLMDSSKDAQAVLTLEAENQSKDILTINTGGRISEYQLTYSAQVRVSIGGVPIDPPMMVTVRRSMNYSDNQVLGKQQEEDLLWADARRDAAEQIVRRLAYLKAPAAEPAGPQSVKPANAVTQP
ncbi:LPS assembly lipoprotein LptE [Chromobacterium sp. IIBBL 290-4]|uniref:LPS-assembly lipoprotein LptE n=1 Tax=Chromobacterium sp. IIBBL 290-4 TaxID=2953890 RepID=UPI0020B712E6|nr:LPS assembly lipoprotein LptE [Chromobacterium sp. IIBBL 290-4]UTH76191.1 LPS assembly lipoprotein LptE [Chromobacterium sp. IIBBL 290-4]